VDKEIVTLICHGQLPNGSTTFSEILVRTNEPEWHNKVPLQRLTIPYHPRSNLPEGRVSLRGECKRYAVALSAALSVTDDHNTNLTTAQKELLKWHYRLGHVGFKWLKWMIRAGRLAVMNKRAISNCDLPKCAACEFGKATKRPTQVDVTRAISDKEMELKKENLLPGQRVSVDHYQSAVPGRLYSSRGGSSQSDQNQFHGGAIFVDHATGKVAVRHQVALSSSDTAKSKLFFEKAAYDDVM
jgi:hypothetical protein